MTDIKDQMKKDILGLKLPLEILERIIEDAPDGIQIVDLTGKIVYSNEAIEKIYGFSPTEYQGKDVNEMNVDPEFAKKVILPIIQKTGAWAGELMVKHKDGHVFPIWLSTSLIKDKFGKPIVMLGLIRDLTEIKKTEEYNKRLAILMETTTDFTSVADLNGKLLFLNTGGRKLIGLGADVHIDELKIADMHPDWATKIILNEGIPSAIKNGTWVGETALLHRNGQEIPVSQVIVAHKDVKGQIDVLATIIRDISGRKQIEENLLESKNKYQALADAAPLCIKWFDPEGNLISVNKHAKEEHKLEGQTDEQIKKWNYWSCIEPKCHAELKTKMKLALEGKEQDILLEHVPGTTTGGHYCQSNLVPVVNGQGKTKYVLFISRDVTAEKEIEVGKNKNLEELQKFKELTIGRELKMIELKKLLKQTQGELEKLKNDH